MALVPYPPAQSRSWRKSGFSRRKRGPEMIDFFIWTTEDVGDWLEGIGLERYTEVFKQNQINGEYLDKLSSFSTEEILRFIRRCRMKWGDFFIMCQELRRVKVACLHGEQAVRRPWWAPPCLNSVFVKLSKKHNARVVSLKSDL